MKIFKLALAAVIAISTVYAKEKIFVVEREDSSLATIVNDVKSTRILNMRNMNHGVVKFEGKDGYVISRDGYVIKFDPISEKISNEYKTSKSAIGFVIGKNYVAVANYDDKSVDILDRDLNPIKKIKTGSKNVGIKIYKNYLVFSQMDNDTISVYKDMNEGKGKAKFEVYKEFKDVGQLPFDAMIKDNNYIAGFFTSSHYGVVDLDTMTYKKIKIYLNKDRKMVLKVPHFGFWSIGGDKVFVPAVGDSKVLVYDDNFKFLRNIETQGLPVFTSLSPKKDFLAVTYSGKDFPTIQIIDTKTLEIIKTFTFDGKVLHIRWSNISPKLYVSVNDTNKVVVVDTNKWVLNKEILNIKKPSGIFLYEDGK
ncbi:cytochrome D1 domain-containing protein [Arcobacter sp. LA11]|uniref:cytochrome D1 domain-containing protein n=1 Tax=Arcobacter sp. LA11 TaxID=1898176 RepID=UPI0009324E5E|nr:cytochrome D1 domain-containing protein [Arcobacter sp. LA11]